MSQHNAKYWLGKKFSLITKKKISKKLTGIKRSKETKKKYKERSERLWQNPEYKKHMSEVHKGQIVWNKGKKLHYPVWNKGKKCPECSKRVSGKNHPNWQGGISRLPYSLDFTPKVKEFIRKRDNHKCQLCGQSQTENKRQLSIHHISYNKQNSNSENLIGLCCSCNTKVNKNREYWTKFFYSIMKKYNDDWRRMYFCPFTLRFYVNVDGTVKKTAALT